MGFDRAVVAVTRQGLAGPVDRWRATREGHLLDLRNDVGVLAAEFDPVDGPQLGNTPQAFSHIGLVNRLG